MPTVFLVGTDRLPLVRGFLDLGSVVVVAPDRETLARWRAEQEPEMAEEAGSPPAGTVVDLAGRRIVSRGAVLPLSDLEFRVLRALLIRPGKALSFAEIRSEGWGDGLEMPFDVCSVRALVQRLRAKLRAEHAPIEVVSVRGFGFRAEERLPHAPLPLSGPFVMDTLSPRELRSG